ncbi:MAG TPA: ATP-dependent DNA helicase RecG, partial [Pirellulales bacterium]|nr:ATP-dependent DNA helicase RecG [Pirellulales bacterium]
MSHVQQQSAPNQSASNRPQKSPAELLATPVTYIKGVGPARAELLERLGLATARDVLFFFPRDYQDLTDMRSIADLEEDKLLSVRGVVEEVELRSTGVGRSLLGVLIRQDRHYLRALWFNQPFMQEKFSRGQEVVLAGKAKFRGGRWEMAHPQVQWIDPDEEPPAGKMLPIYPLTEGLRQGNLRNIVRAALDNYSDLLDEVFPESYLAAKNLWPLKQALRQVHFPDNPASLMQAKRRFVYQELFILQLGLALRRHGQLIGGNAPPLESTPRIDARIRRLFPWELTSGQNEAIKAIAADMSRSTAMNRLLHGDVGSGKTVVAVYAMLLAVAHGHQAALMAPTEVLARQHFRTLSGLLTESRVRIGLLTGALTGREREELLRQITRGEVDIVVGTQAIVRSEVEFAKLGLVVIDEQHKFGVRQRAMLRQAGSNPHCLIMTATPIPRTVTMTLYGDLDVSTIADRPAGRQNIHTYLVRPEERAKWWDFVRRKLAEGRQSYVVVPLVEESENIATANLEAMFEELAHGELAAFRLGLVHGRLPPEEKESAMQAFREGRTQVLVATSVVEVGIDVPNATLMSIAGAERFGLAQLHQMRGRISRGAHPGYCAVFADSQSEEVIERLQAFVD